MKIILKEEISRIYELMGIKNGLILEDSPGVSPWYYDLGETLFKTLLGVANEKSLNRYDLDKAYGILDEEAEIIREWNQYQQLTPAQKSATKNKPKSPEDWKKSVFEDDNRKNLYLTGKSLKKEYPNKQDLGNIIDKIITKEATQNEIDTVLKALLSNPGTKKQVLNIFYSKNPVAGTIKESWANLKLKNFKDENSIDETFTRIKQQINNAQSNGNIPDYVVDDLLAELEEQQARLKEALQGWKTKLGSDGVQNVIKKYKFRMQDPIWNTFREFFKSLTRLFTQKSRYVFWGEVLGESAKMQKAHVYDVCQDIYEWCVKEGKTAEYETILLYMFDFMQNGALQRVGPAEISFLQKIYPLIIDTGSVQQAWRQFIQDPTNAGWRQVPSWWKSKSTRTCFNGFRWPKTMSERVEVLNSTSKDKSIITEFFINIIYKLQKSVYNPESNAFKGFKCAWVPLAAVSFITYLITGLSLGEQVEGLPNIKIVKPVLKWLVDYKSKKDIEKHVKTLFPDVKYLIYSESFTEEEIEKLNQYVKKVKQKLGNEEDNSYENAEANEKSNVKNDFKGIILKYAELKYWVVCADYSDDEIYNNTEEWILYNPNDESEEKLSQIALDDNFKRINTFVKFLSDNKNSEYNNFDYSETDWECKYSSANSQIYELYYKQALIDQYTYDSTNQTFVSSKPNQDAFFTALTNDKAKVTNDALLEKLKKLNSDLNDTRWDTQYSNLLTNGQCEPGKYQTYSKDKKFYVKGCDDPTYLETYQYVFDATNSDGGYFDLIAHSTIK